MNPLTHEWVEKADGDFHVAGRELRTRKMPNYDAVCFHAQQCAEKYLKAILQEHDQRIPKIHHLAELLTLVTKVEPTCQFLLADLDVLEDYAIEFRYPGLIAEKGEAQSAFKAAQRVRIFVRQRLGLA
ncbi:MAG: DNA-binding protein [Anaerolinea sp.]|nr:DNA-binding protein [Anaerolinea sp.]